MRTLHPARPPVNRGRSTLPVRADEAGGDPMRLFCLAQAAREAGDQFELRAILGAMRRVGWAVHPLAGRWDAAEARRWFCIGLLSRHVGDRGRLRHALGACRSSCEPVLQRQQSS